MRLRCRAVEREDLLPQYRSLEGPARFPHLVRGPRLVQSRVGQQPRLVVRVGQPGLAVVLGQVHPGDALTVEERAGVEPGAGEDGRDMGRRIGVAIGRGSISGAERRELLRVRLLDQAEAAKFALDPVEVAVPVGVARHEPVAADQIARLHPCHYMDRERHPGDPRPARAFVVERELRRRRIGDPRLGAEIVREPDQQVRLRAAHEIDVAHLPVASAGQRRGPDQARRAVAQQVRGGDDRSAVDRGKAFELVHVAPGVATLVEGELHPAASQVDQVGRS